MRERCYQCGFRRQEYSTTDSNLSYYSDSDDDEEDDDNIETEGYYCECEESDDESMTTPTQKQKNNLLKMQLARINAFQTQDIEKGNFDVTFDLDGKLLHAHKFIFTAVSTTMEAWISDRWTNKDDIIKIETYTYDEFFQLLLFLYSGTCDITQDNISRLIDIAEFFDVSVMKEHCDTILSKMIRKIGIDTVEDMMEMAQKYSLSHSIEALYKFIRQNRQKIITSEEFIKFKRPFIDALFCVDKNAHHEQLFFLTVIKWAEHQVSTKKPTLKGTDFLDAVKTELGEMKSKFDFLAITIDFVMESIVNKNFLFSFSELYNILGKCNYYRVGKEKCFKIIFELAEKEALKEENNSIDENFDLRNAIEEKMAEVLPTVTFKRMKFEFVKQFVVEKAFLFSSKGLYDIIDECQRTDEEEREVFKMLYELAEKNVKKGKFPGEILDLQNAIKMELSECLPKIKFHKMGTEFLVDFAAKTGFMSNQEAIHCSYINVQIKSGGKHLHGEFEDIFNIHNCANGGVRRIDSGWTYDVTPLLENKLRFTGLKFKVPQSPSPVHLKHGVEWYLLLGLSGTLAVTHQSRVKHGDYLIAELRADENFSFNGQKTCFTVSHNNIF